MCFWTLLAILGFVGLVPLLRRAVQRYLSIQPNAGEMTCACGYPLGDLDRARCPECGRVLHFDATPEELGLTDQQLEEIQTKQKRRAEGDQVS